MSIAEGHEGRLSYTAKRVAAFSVDAAIVWLLLALIRLLPASVDSIWWNALVYLGYRAMLPALFEVQTLGRSLFDMTVETCPRDRPAKAFSLLVRELPIALVLAGPGLGLGLLPGFVILFGLGPNLLACDLVSVLVRPDRRSWRDLLANTRVVDW